MTRSPPTEPTDEGEFEWGYAETVRMTCPSCGHQSAIVTDTHEFGGGRCIPCDEQMKADYR